MNFPVKTSSHYSAAELAAADWTVLHDSGLDPEKQKQFQEWLEADPDHARAFAALDETWSVLDKVGTLKSSVGTLDPDVLAPARLEKILARPSVGRRFRWPVALAAAAVVVFGFIGWSQLSPERDFAQMASTEIGDLRRIDLPDGSVVQLNTASVAEVRYSGSERRVNLTQGEAHFTVEKNTKKPFIVSVRGVDIQAVGTAFNVRLRPETVEVLVTEGKVRVTDAIKGGSLLAQNAALFAAPLREKKPESPARPPMLGAGELAVISLETPSRSVPVVPVSVPQLQVQRTLAWQERRLEFASVPLAEMVAEFNRYNRHRLVIADSRLAQQHFGGNFHSDGYEVLVHLLEVNYGVIVEKHADETRLRLPR